MRRAICLLAALSLVLSLAACAAGKEPAPVPESMVSGGGVIVFSGSREDPEPGPAQGENPPAVLEEGPSYAPIPSSSVPSYSSSSISYPESSSQSSQGSTSGGGQSVSSGPAPSSVSSSTSPSGSSSRAEQDDPPAADPEDEVRAVWLSYLELGPLLSGKSESAFTASIGKVMDNIRGLGLNTVYAQVRPFGDALYYSDYFPSSYLFTGAEGEIGSQPYDALEIMVRAAHSRGLRIEAWLNPYRVRTTGLALSDDNPAREMLDTGDALRYDGGIYYNPGSPAARELILDGVREIVQNYDVDGIHFDDYFYPPNATAAFDAETYAEADTSKSLAAWRREQVDLLVKAVYQTVGSGKVFGISPAGNSYNNYNALYCDVEKWLTTPGYVDYICPQVYFGFEHRTKPYKATAKEFNDLISQSGVKLYVGLASCNIGGGQQSGSEWVNNTDMMARQVEYARTLSRYGGFALYRYDSLFNPASGVSGAVKEEIANLKEIL